MVFRGLGVPKNASSVNSAKLLLDFTLSETGQKALSKGRRTPLRPSISSAMVDGSETFQSITDTIGEANEIMINYDPDLVDSSAEFVSRWKSANGV